MRMFYWIFVYFTVIGKLLKSLIKFRWIKYISVDHFDQVVNSSTWVTAKVFRYSIELIDIYEFDSCCGRPKCYKKVQSFSSWTFLLLVWCRLNVTLLKKILPLLRVSHETKFELWFHLITKRNCHSKNNLNPYTKHLGTLAFHVA